MNYFFHPAILSEGDTIILSEEEGRHVVKVLRSSKGDSIHILNGKGQMGEGEIASISGSRIGVTINAIANEKKSDHELTIAVAVLKKRDRLEWFIEKAIELAADKIIIFSSRHSERNNVDLNRLNKIAISALKQSGNLWMPEIVNEIGFQKLISEDYSRRKFIAHCREGQKQLLKDAYKASENAIVLIGPEGDFSQDEVAEAIEKQFVPVSMGNLRLRAETAALTALITLQVVNQKIAT